MENIEQATTPKWATKNNSYSPETSHTSNGKHALLIGIETYNNPKIDDLNGAINDVHLIQGVLRNRFKFKESDFIVLLNQQATHSCIEEAFQKLIKRIQPNDFVYIHYSGHGSQTTDLNGDEPSGLDQTWVSYGTRQAGNGRENEKDNYEVLDDEINAWLAAIYAKTKHVIFVSDSCHSATVSRGGNVPVSRGLEADERSHLLGKMPYTQLDELHGIHIGAARNKEFAAETDGDDGKDYGIFTWYWAKALQQAKVGETWDDVFKRAYTPVFSKRGEAQRPQLEGKRYRQVFGGKLTPPIATVAVSNVNGNLVKIRAGATVGVTVGSTYRLHLQKNKARIEITKVGTFESEAKITLGRFKLGDLLVEESHAYDFKAIKVYLSADYPKKDRSLLQSIRTAFGSEIPAYVLTNKANLADLRLQLLRPKRGKNGQAIYEHENDALPKSYSNQSPELWVLTPDQHLLQKKLQIKFSDKSKGLELLKYNLNHFARLREIKALQSSYQSATLAVTLQTTIFKPVKTCPTGGNCMQLYDLGFYEKKLIDNFQEIGRQSLNKNDILTFTLHNTSRQDYYCYLINISPDGTIFAIYPDPDERMEYARVKAGEKRELITDVILILKNVGEQSLKFIATTRPIQISLLQKDGYRGNQRKLNPLERLLVSAAHGERGELIKLSNDEWVTEQVMFEVK